MMNEFMGEMAERKSVQIPVVDRVLNAEVSGDYSLPDYQPEIKRLLRIGVNILPPNRFAGAGGMELHGTLDYYVLYMGHDGGVYCAPLSTEYRMAAAPDEGDGSQAAIGEPMICLCDTSAEPPVGRVTAPRRLSIRCKLRAAVKLYGEHLLESDDDEDDTVERLMGEENVGRLYWALGDTLPLQDDVILPPTEGEWRVICAEGQVMMTEAIPTAGAVNCRGEVALKLMLCPAEATDSTTPPPISLMQRKIPFTQSIDMEGITPACMATAHASCTDISVQMEEGHLHVDLGVVTEVRAQQNQPIRYVRDLYSTRRGESCRYATYPTESAVRALNGNFTLSDSLPVEEAGVDPAARVVDVTAAAFPEALTTDTERGRCILTGKCRCHLLLLKDGEYASADMELPFRYEFEDQGLTEAGASERSFDGSVTVESCRTRMDSERVGVDAELAVSLRTHTPAPVTALCEASFGDEVVRRRGEYVICFPAPTDTVWSVAKRYHAPMAALTAANSIPLGAKVDAPESLEGVGYLIV